MASRTARPEMRRRWGYKLVNRSRTDKGAITQIDRADGTGAAERPGLHEDVPQSWKPGSDEERSGCDDATVRRAAVAVESVAG